MLVSFVISSRTAICGVPHIHYLFTDVTKGKRDAEGVKRQREGREREKKKKKREG